MVPVVSMPDLYKQHKSIQLLYSYYEYLQVVCNSGAGDNLSKFS